VLKGFERPDARSIRTVAVPESDWKRPEVRPHTSWLATELALADVQTEFVPAK